MAYTRNEYKQEIAISLRVPGTPNWISFPTTFVELPGKSILFVNSRVVQLFQCPLG